MNILNNKHKPLSNKAKRRIVKRILALLTSKRLNADGYIEVGTFQANVFNTGHPEPKYKSKKQFDSDYTAFKTQLTSMLDNYSKTYGMELRVKCELKFHDTRHASLNPVIEWSV